MLDEVSKALDMLWDDKEVRVVIIRGGAGDRAFSAGADVTSFQGAAAYVLLLRLQ